MTHTSGLRPDVDVGEVWTGYDKAIELAIEEVPTAPPGERFVYSDINYFLLGDIVKRVSGQPLDQFAQQAHLRAARDEGHDVPPAAALRPRIAPTEKCTPYGWPCAGPGHAVAARRVHDPTARRMGGVAGHAGLFSTAADLSIFARMLLNGGRYNGVRVLVAAHGRQDDDAGERRRGRQRARPRAGTSIRRSRPIAASCCRSARSGTPASPARRCGSIRRPGCSSCSCRTASIRTARVT